MAKRWFKLFSSFGNSPQLYLAILEKDEALRFEATYYEEKWQSGWVEYHYRVPCDEDHKHSCSLFGDDSCDMGHLDIYPPFGETCLKALINKDSDAVFELLEEQWEKDHATNT